MKASLLLFGAGGQLARAILDQAAVQNCAVVGFRHNEVDVCDRVAVADAIRRVQPELVINAAGYTAVDKAECEPTLAHAVNATGAEVVAQGAAAQNIPLLHFSTDFVFDGRKSEAYVEDDAVAPLCVYGQTKWEGEARVRASAPMHIIVRTAWVYGIAGHNFLKTILRLAGERDELSVVSDQYGSPTATIDLAKATLEIYRSLSHGSVPWGTYHFAGEGVTTWHGFASEIIEAQSRFTGRQPLLRAIATAEWPSRATRPGYSALDSNLFFRTFGYRAEPWQMRTAQVVAALLENTSADSYNRGRP